MFIYTQLHSNFACSFYFYPRKHQKPQLSCFQNLSKRLDVVKRSQMMTRYYNQNNLIIQIFEIRIYFCNINISLANTISLLFIIYTFDKFYQIFQDFYKIVRHINPRSILRLLSICGKYVPRRYKCYADLQRRKFSFVNHTTTIHSTNDIDTRFHCKEQ